MPMEKDFDAWNSFKKKLDAAAPRYDLFFVEREVWWCALGINVGVESNGKNHRFERPVLIIKKFNGEMVWVLPLTSKQKSSPNYQQVSHDDGISWVYLSQIKTISTKRLLRKIGMIGERDFLEICLKVAAYIKISDPAFAGSSEAEATNMESISELAEVVN
jgi:mRNA interferase MazF